MKILAIDLGKFKSVMCVYDSVTHEHEFGKVQTRPQVMHDLIVEHQPDRVVFENGGQAGWMRDLCEALGVEFEVANPNHEGWRWKNIKRKTDRDDALKLAKLSAAGQLPTVQLPPRRVRQWRALIAYRSSLVGRRTAIKNGIRALLDRQGERMRSGRSGWTAESLERLRSMSRPIESLSIDELWRGQLALELKAFEQVQALLRAVESKLDAIAESDDRVARLRTIPGVGPRLAETVVAVINDPHRFASRREVASYVGLVPRQFESGTMSRQGRITGAGHGLLRSLLVEVSWLMRQHNPTMAAVFDKVCRGSKTRRKIAVVATARRLLVICWAMLRDRTTWQPPQAVT